MLRGHASEPVIHKTVRGLVEDGELDDKIVTVNQSTFKCLYVPYREKNECLSEV